MCVCVSSVYKTGGGAGEGGAGGGGRAKGMTGLGMVTGLEKAAFTSKVK